ncbi:MAG: hypothetical protein RIQ56_762 [Candidatus Parcubacteria bacterium]|jgi:hypothetical protein
MELKPYHIEQGYKNHATLFVYHGLRALVVLTAIYYLVLANFESAAATFVVVALMYLPSFVKSRYRLYLPFALDLWIVSFIFLTLFVGGVGNVYNDFPIWDKLLHFQSGLLLAAAGYVAIYLLNESEGTSLDLSPGFISVFAVAFALALGVMWEMLEFFGDLTFGSSWQNGNTDTMVDLIADGIGAVIFSAGAYFWMYRHKRVPFTPRLLKFYEKAKKVAKEMQTGVRK